MSNIYIGYHFKVEPKEVGSEILIAELGETAFESFTETETEFLLYKRNYGTEQFENIRILKSAESNILTKKLIP
jgi:ribosomal protein L11 methyltransferase